MNFCMQNIEVDAGLRPDSGLLRLAALKVTADAQACAQRHLDAAHATAAHIVQQAQHEADALTAEAEQRSIEAMRHYQQAFDTQYASFMQRAQPLVVQLALGLFDQLVLSLSERERIDVLANRLAHEAPTKLSEAMLHLHPSDAAQLPDPEWPVKPDSGLTPGTAMLIASSGEWRMNFSVAVDTLKTAMLRHQHDPLDE